MLWARAARARFSPVWSIATSIVLLLPLAPTSSIADVIVVRPLDEQYPAVAHLGESFSWSFRDFTFNSSSDDELSYDVSGLPRWASFDGETRTFSGTPSSHEETGTTRVTITASDGSDSPASSSFGLLVSSNPAPTLEMSLVSQLATASSLGRSQILPGNKLHIPFGWSFSVGWQGSTFTLPSEDKVYTYGTIDGLEPLPDWLKYSPDTFAMWGIAPNTAPSEGTEFVFTLSGANAVGYAGTQTNLTIVLGEGKISMNSATAATGSTLDAVNATVGIQLEYTIPTTIVSIDGQPVRDPHAVTMTADTTSAGSWLLFDSDSRTLSGIPPSDVVMEPAGATVVTIPITVENSLAQSLTLSLPLAIYPPAFSNNTLPNVYVNAGQPFQVALTDFIRNSDQANISASFDPASPWMSYDANSLILSGTAPADFSEASKVAVTLTNNAKTEGAGREALARRDDTPSNQAVFYVALSGTEAGNPATTGNSIPPGDGTGPAENRRKRIIIGAVIGTILGLLLIGILILLFLRKCKRRNENFKTPASSIATKSPALSDDRTLRDDTSPGFISAPFKKLKNKEGASPATLYGASPLLYPNGHPMHAEHYAGQDGGELRGILITSDRYPNEQRQDMYYSNGAGDACAAPYAEDVYGGYEQEQGPERPQQHGMMAALVSGTKSKHPSQPSPAEMERAHTAPVAADGLHVRSESAGLGLMGVKMEKSGSGGSSGDHPYSRRSAHTRSRMSLRSSVSKESWEDDLFYEGPSSRGSRAATAGSFDGVPHPRATSVNALNAITEEEEVPRRRGNARVSSRNSHMRHRSAHVKTSPSFAATAAFANPSSDESSSHDQSYGGEHLVRIDGTGESEEGQYGSSNDFVIGTAQRVDVRGLGRNGSINSRTPELRTSYQRSESMHVDAQGSASGAFEDADDEAQPLPRGIRPGPSSRNNRDSAFSTMTTDSNMIALSPYISYPEPEERSDVMSTSVYSPRPPSFFGGASIASNVRPEDTLRAVDYSGRSGPPSPLLFPPSPASQHQSKGSALPVGAPPVPPPPRPQSRIIPEELEATVSVGERIRIKLTPPGGPSMRGAAGSAGTRAGKKGKYIPLYDNVMMQAHGTWPIWLSEWIFWDPNMFELSGEVPLDFSMDIVTIALVHRKACGGTSGPGSPKRGGAVGGHRREDSNEMAVEDEVVARLTLIIEQPYEATFEGEQGHDVPLQRGGGGSTGTAF